MKSPHPTQINPNPIWTLQFLLVCFSSLLFSASFNMLLPELPGYLSSIGGAEYKGLIVSLFTLTAALSRPLSGKLTDTIGRVPVMAVGSLVCFVCGFLYPVLGTVAGFLFLRLLHGFSTGFKPTATAAYVADLIPQERWGEGLGIHGLFFSTGLAIGPAIGSAITNHYSIQALFYVSSFFALLSILILMSMKETLRIKRKLSWETLRVRRADVFEPAVIPSAFTMFFSTIPFGVILTLLPDWSQHLHLENKGLFFMVFTIASLAIRFVAGKASDQYGRVPMLLIGLVLLSISMVLIGLSDGLILFMVAAVIYGISAGVASPAIMAWTIDLAEEFQRGRAIATMYIAMETGIGLGALLSGWFYNNQIERIPWVMHITAGVVLIPVIYLLRNHRPKRR